METSRTPKPWTTNPICHLIAWAIFATVFYCMFSEGFFIAFFVAGYVFWLVSCILRLHWASTLIPWMITIWLICLLLSHFVHHERDYDDYDYEPRHMEKR